MQDIIDIIHLVCILSYVQWKGDQFPNTCMVSKPPNLTNENIDFIDPYSYNWFKNGLRFPIQK